jgi:PAS domain S-box-containing protein
VLADEQSDRPQGGRDADIAAFFELSSDLFSTADRDGHFIQLNPAWERVLGWSRAELRARAALTFIHPDDRERTLAVGNRGDPASRHAVHLENRYRCKDGSYRWLQWNAVSLGELWYGVARDVTDRKRLEPTCAAMHGVYALYALSGRYGPDVHGLGIDSLAVPAGVYFLWVVYALYRGTFVDWNGSPLRARDTRPHVAGAPHWHRSSSEGSGVIPRGRAGDNARCP